MVLLLTPQTLFVYTLADVTSHSITVLDYYSFAETLQKYASAYDRNKGDSFD
jgi:hypothetical protein